MTEHPTTILDRIIGYLSPKWQAERVAYQMVAGNIKRGIVDAVNNDRLNGGWARSVGSADSDLSGDLANLRSAFRKLQLNSPFVARMIDAVAIGAIGTGLRPQSRVMADASPEGGPALIGEAAAEIYNSSMERVYEEWQVEADAGGRMSFPEIQRFAVERAIADGDIFIRFVNVDDANRILPLGLQLYEADQVLTPSNAPNKESIRDGIRLGPHGEPIEYFVAKVHPGDTLARGQAVLDMSRFDTVPASEMVHLYIYRRPGLTRGYPFFTAALKYLQHLDKYWEAEIIAARTAACTAGVITTQSPSSFIDALQTTNREGSISRKEIERVPGVMQILPEGMEYNAEQPGRPNSQFGGFTETLIRAIGICGSLPLEIMLLDFSKTNYSSARASLLEARYAFANMTNLTDVRLCRRTWNRMAKQAVDRSLVATPSSWNTRRRDWLRHKWTHPGYQSIDYLKETEASIRAIEGNISTIQLETAKRGEDWEDILGQRGKEERRKKAEDLNPPSPKQAQSYTQEPTEDQGDG